MKRKKYIVTLGSLTNDAIRKECNSKEKALEEARKFLERLTRYDLIFNSLIQIYIKR